MSLPSADIALVWSHAPYQNTHGRESLDLALTYAALEIPVSLFFIYDGIFQLRASQHQHNPLMTAQTALFASCHYYDLADACHVCQQDLDDYSLAINDLSIACQVHEKKKLNQLLDQHHHVIQL